MLTLYIIPGYFESERDFAYREIRKLAQAYGIKSRIIKIPWRSTRGSFKTWSESFLRQYRESKDEKTIVLGFSFGAMIALITAHLSKPDRLILCSLSPYFIEDQRYLRPQWQRWWRSHMKDSDVSFASVAKSVRMPTTILVGKREAPECLRRAKIAARDIRSACLEIIPAAGHKIGGAAYLKTLDSIFATLSSSAGKA